MAGISASEQDASRQGYLLIGHGTRDPQGLAEFAETVRQVADQVDPIPVESAFLELATPTIQAGWDRLVERGVRRIVAAPLLLFAAGHAKQDIPNTLDAAAGRHPGIEWRLAEHLGCHPSLLELSKERFLAAVSGRGTDPSRYQLVVVGRGSRDEEATAETRRYAQLLGEQVGVRNVQVGFLAMALPKFADVLAEAAASDSPTVVVQPHLLFHGELLDAVQAQVRAWQKRVPGTDRLGKRWLVTGHLGPAPQLVTALLERCR